MQYTIFFICNKKQLNNKKVIYDNFVIKYNLFYLKHYCSTNFSIIFLLLKTVNASKESGKKTKFSKNWYLSLKYWHLSLKPWQMPFFRMSKCVNFVIMFGSKN